jgi:hypothetical protein
MEAVAAACLGAPADDCRLGDLSEQYVRTECLVRERLAGLPGAVIAAQGIASTRYLAATANVMIFARGVDSGQRLYGHGVAALMALDLRERTVAMVQFTVRKFALSALLLACGALLANGAVEAWNSWRQTERLMESAQRERAEVAAQRIASFLSEVERQIGWVAYAQFAKLPPGQRRFDYVRLLRQVPAIAQLTLLDEKGHEQLAVNRLSMDVVDSDIDRSTEPAFVAITKNRLYVGPVYIRRASEPYLTMALAHGGRPVGATIAEVNLIPVRELISAIKLDEGGYAYLVDGKGRLVVYQDAKFALQLPDLSGQPQVAAALAGKTSASLAEGRSFDPSGVARPVRSASAAVAGLDWKVVVDVPSSTYDLLFRSSMIRIVAMGGLALVAAVLAMLLALRPVLPARPAQA